MKRCKDVYVNMEALDSVQHAGRTAETRVILEPHFCLCTTLTCSVKLTSDTPCQHSKPAHLIVFDRATVRVCWAGQQG